MGSADDYGVQRVDKNGIPFLGGVQRLPTTKSKECIKSLRQQWKNLRKKLKPLVLERDGYRCRYCGISHSETVEITVDHIVPLSSGGSNEIDNLTAACVTCNHDKGTMRADRFENRRFTEMVSEAASPCGCGDTPHGLKPDGFLG